MDYWWIMRMFCYPDVITLTCWLLLMVFVLEFWKKKTAVTIHDKPRLKRHDYFSWNNVWAVSTHGLHPLSEMLPKISQTIQTPLRPFQEWDGGLSHLTWQRNQTLSSQILPQMNNQDGLTVSILTIQIEFHLWCCRGDPEGRAEPP